MGGIFYVPTPEEIEQENAYWESLDRIGDYDAWLEGEMAALADFRIWPLDDLLDEFDLVRTLTPDQSGLIAELEAEIEPRLAA
jgi:hypothetical protein